MADDDKEFDEGMGPFDDVLPLILLFTVDEPRKANKFCS